MKRFILPERLQAYDKKCNVKSINRGTLVDDETFLDICEGFMDWFEERKDLLVKNILQVYDLTDGEVGYNALDHDWKKWKDIRTKQGTKTPAEKFTAEMIEDMIKEKILAACCHLGQDTDYEKSPVIVSKRYAFIGLMVLVALNVEIYTKVKGGSKDVSVNYSVSLDIPAHRNEHFSME